MFRKKISKQDCWGYFLPMVGTLPAIPLEQDKISVGSEDCDINAEQVGCLRTVLSKRHFEVIRTETGLVIKNNSVKQIFINDCAIQCGQQLALCHNAIIAIKSHDNKVLRYVDMATSDKSGHNPEVKKKYAVAHTLGHGGYGEVFLIIEKKSHKVFALKVSRQSIFAKREAYIAQKLRFPFLIHIHSIILNPDKMYLVMDYMNGGDLSQWVNTMKCLTEQQLKLIFYQLALAVEYLHEKGIGHRDLKPSNILLEKNDPYTLIKVTDFGLAKDEHIHSTMNTVAGSEPYVAPEVTDSKPYTKQVDLWSMGIILFYGLTGKIPFKDISDAKTKDYKIMYDSKDWKGVSKAAFDLVQKLLVKIPTKRISIQELLRDEWLQDEGMKTRFELLTASPERRKISAPTNPSHNNIGDHRSNRKLSVPEGRSREKMPRGVMQFMKSSQDLPKLERKDSILKRLFPFTSKKK